MNVFTLPFFVLPNVPNFILFLSHTLVLFGASKSNNEPVYVPETDKAVYVPTDVIAVCAACDTVTAVVAFPTVKPDAVPVQFVGIGSSGPIPGQTASKKGLPYDATIVVLSPWN